MFASVIVDINHSEVDKIFEYSFSGLPVKLGSRVLVPFGNKYVEGIVIGIKDTADFDEKRIKPVYSVLEETPALFDETVKLTEFIKSKCYVSRALSLRLFLPSEMRKGKIKEKFTNYVLLNQDFDVNGFLRELRKSAVKQREFTEFILDGKKHKLADMNEKFGSGAVKSVIDKGVATIIKEQSFRSPYLELLGENKNVNLTEMQKKAVDSIENTDKKITLLYGVTGSGKTEVYLKLISDAIKSGKSAIMLVPEIALTPQMLKQLRARFQDNAAILHSGLSAGERFDEWWRIRNGEAKIVIGARSAIFAPVSNVGVIIIDEEHDGSYCSESSPRYSTLDVAKFRAEYNDAKLVLGSATPSIESYLNAVNGEYNLAVLPERINKKALPSVEIVDMRKEIRRGNNSPFSSALISELNDCLKNGNQAMIFLNQRGYSKTVFAPNAETL